MQRFLGGRGKKQAVFQHNFLCLGAGTLIRMRGAGGDYIHRIPQHIAEHDGDQLCRGQKLGKAPALDSGKTLAQAVDFADIRPACQ